jgi:hypothetical protein
MPSQFFIYRNCLLSVVCRPQSNFSDQLISRFIDSLSGSSVSVARQRHARSPLLSVYPFAQDKAGSEHAACATVAQLYRACFLLVLIKTICSPSDCFCSPYSASGMSSREEDVVPLLTAGRTEIASGPPGAHTTPGRHLRCKLMLHTNQTCLSNFLLFC